MEEKKQEFLQAIGNFDLTPYQQEEALAVRSNGQKIALEKVCTLGTGLEPIVSFAQNYLSKGEGKSGFYYVHMSPGKHMTKFKDGSAFTGNVVGNKNLLEERARLNYLGMNPTMLFVAATLANLNEKLDTIQETQEDMLNFIAQKEKSALKGNLDFLMDLYSNYKFNWDSDKYKDANHIKALDIRQNAAQMIDFYRERIKKHVSKKALLHRDLDVKKMLGTVKDEFKEYQLALYLFGFSSFLEVLLQENFDQDYLSAITSKIETMSFEYRDLFTKVYSLIESKSKSSLESKLFGGLSVVNKLAGETIAKIPVVNKSQIDETLISAGEKLGKFKDKRTETTMKYLAAQQSSSVRPFIDNINAINELYNQPVTLVFDEDYLYLGTGSQEN